MGNEKSWNFLIVNSRISRNYGTDLLAKNHYSQSISLMKLLWTSYVKREREKSRNYFRDKFGRFDQRILIFSFQDLKGTKMVIVWLDIDGFVWFTADNWRLEAGLETDSINEGRWCLLKFLVVSRKPKNGMHPSWLLTTDLNAPNLVYSDTLRLLKNGLS